MSKEKPEVGDVWVSPFTKYRVIAFVGQSVDCLVDEEQIRHSYLPISYLTDHCKYLGKSKVKIEELFDVKD